MLAKPEGAPDSTRGVANVPRAPHPPRRFSQRGAGPPAQGQARHPLGRLRRGRIRRRRGVSAVRRAERPEAQAGPSDGKGLGRMMELTNAARLGIALFALGNARRALVESLCYARQRRAFGGRAHRQAADAAQAGRDDRRRRSRASVGVRRHRRRQPPPAPQHAATHRGARHQAQGVPARDHRGVGRDRDPRRQRLYRNLAGGPAAARRAGEHHLGGPRQHPVSRRAARYRADSGARDTAGAAARRGVGLRRRRDHAPGRQPHRGSRRGDHGLGQTRQRRGRGAAVPAGPVHGRRLRRCVAHRAGRLGAGYPRR